MFARGYKTESFNEDWKDVYTKFEAIVDKYLPDEDKIEREIKKLYYLHKGEPDWDKAWEKWNRPNMYNISESKYHRYKNRVNEAEDTIGKDVEKYQRWVDYDMKKYKRVSDQTKRELKKAGLQLVKDQYGDYEVTAGDFSIKESLIESSSNLKLNKSVRDFYLKKYPTDDLGEEISDNITFYDLFDALKNGKDIYRIIGVHDSVIRERVFKELSNISGYSYDYIYSLWENS